MFRAYEYFREAAPGCGIPNVYRVTGLSRLEELARSIRETRFPCLAVEVGADGILNVLTAHTTESYHTFYVLDTVGDRPEDMDRIARIMQETFQMGEALIRRMRADASDITGPCYGLDAARVTYSSIGPVGMHCYGYGFSFTMTRDHE